MINIRNIFLSLFHYGTLFTRIFTSDLATTEQALLYLKSYAFDTVLVCFLFCFNGDFNDRGNTTFVMLHSVLSAVALRIPLAYLFSKMENTNLFWVGLGAPIATFVQITVCGAYYWVLRGKKSWFIRKAVV